MGLNVSNQKQERRAVRQPTVAGVFYPDEEQDLRRLVIELLDVVPVRYPLGACLAPHAGYLYSGGVAGQVFGHVEIPERVIVLGPNHTGYGPRISVASQDAWLTPLGEIPVETGLARAVLESFSKAECEGQAHWQEHSIEVQLPFLKVRQEAVSILPICLMHLELDDCLALGRALADVVADADDPIGFVVSTDMSHYVAEKNARELDALAIEAVLSLDAEKLYHTVHERRISMCGVIPATVALAAVRELGVTAGHQIAYATSGDVSGDRSAVVGYAGVCLYQA